MDISQWDELRSSIHEAFYDDLVKTSDCGAFDGGCLVVAKALQAVIGGEIVVLVRDDDTADHAAVASRGLIWDYDGPLTPSQFIERFNRQELSHLPWECSGYRPIRDGDLPRAFRDDALVLRLAAHFAQMLAGQNMPTPRSIER